MKIIAIKIADENKTARKWFWGSADHQRATTACQPGEMVYPVEIWNGSGYQCGFAVGGVR